MQSNPLQQGTSTNESGPDAIPYYQTINEARAAYGLPPVTATQNEDKSSLGVGIGLVICGVILFAFVRIVPMGVILSTAFYFLALVSLLFGVLGTCSLAFERRRKL